MAIRIPLSKTGKHAGKYEAIISDEDSDLARLNWGVNPRSTKNIYAQRENGNRKLEQMHRVILSRILERELLLDEYVDHINHDGLDNRRENLRLCNVSQNAKNRRANDNPNGTGFKGVYKRGKRYRAQIAVNGIKKMLGTFDTPEQAHEAYKQAAIQYHGEFASFE